MFDLLDLIRKLLSQIIIGIIRGFELMEELRYVCHSGCHGYVCLVIAVAMGMYVCHIGRHMYVCLS